MNLGEQPQAWSIVPQGIEKAVSIERQIYIRHYTYSTFLDYTVHISEVFSLCYKWQNECSLRYTSNRARIKTQVCLLLSSLFFPVLFYCRLRYKPRLFLFKQTPPLGLTKMCTEQGGVGKEKKEVSKLKLISLVQGLTTFCCKRPNSKYFRFCMSCDVISATTAQFGHDSPEASTNNTQTNGVVVFQLNFIYGC